MTSAIKRGKIQHKNQTNRYKNVQNWEKSKKNGKRSLWMVPNGAKVMIYTWLLSYFVQKTVHKRSRQFRGGGVKMTLKFADR